MVYNWIFRHIKQHLFVLGIYVLINQNKKKKNTYTTRLTPSKVSQCSEGASSDSGSSLTGLTQSALAASGCQQPSDCTKLPCLNSQSLSQQGGYWSSSPAPSIQTIQYCHIRMLWTNLYTICLQTFHLSV